MEFEKRSSKRSFLQLFEWNAKSKKKLFSNKSESSEKSKQGKENSNGSASSLHQVHRNGCTAGSDIIENYSSNNPSSPNEDTMYGTKAPGVVARLMGLDSLPSSDVVEPSLIPVLGSESFRASQYSTGFPGFRSEEHIIMYDGMRNKLDEFVNDSMELMLHKVQNRPIERFQTEVLPPKSAKPISITHHRLLSPIKSPRFIRTMDADYLMEAAAKIIEQSPRSIINQKFPSLGLSSVPLRMQDIKEKVEMAERSRRNLQTSQKDKEQRFTRHVNRKSSDIVPGQAEGMELLMASGKPKTAISEDSRRIKSLSVQAKPNVLKRDGPSSVGSRSSANRSQGNEAKHSFADRKLEKKHKNVEIESRTSKQSNILRQNKQKQISEPNEERNCFRRSLVNEKEKKQPSSAGFSRSNKIVNRIVVSSDYLSKRTNSLVSDSRKDQASAVAKKSLRKKEVSNRNRVLDEGNFATSRRDEGPNNCNYEIQKSNMWDSANGKSGTDVVSFTFNSPIKKPTPECTSSGKSPESKRSSFVITDSCNNQSVPLEVAGGDALSILLEQKLKELASRVESSQQDHSEVLCSSAESSQCSVSFSAITGSNSSNLNSQLDSSGDRTGISFRFGCSSSSSLSEPWPESMTKRQGSNEVCKRTIPLYSESDCKSSETSTGISSKVSGSEQLSSDQTLETCGWSSSRNSQIVDIELLDSASSTSLQTSTSDSNYAFTSSIIESSKWELYYIRSILSYATLTSEEVALGQSQKLIAPYIFDLLEGEKAGWKLNMGENIKLPHKVLFDCVDEALQLKCKPLINKSSKHWMKLIMLFEQTDWLSEEVYREISGWTSMEELMVDVLVEKDMSTQLGRWVDFEIEAFEEGIEIEKEILTSLFDELISEFFLS